MKEVVQILLGRNRRWVCGRKNMRHAWVRFHSFAQLLKKPEVVGEVVGEWWHPILKTY
jgi:hypothetical protein